MAGEIQAPYRTFIATSAVAAHVLVKMDGTTLDSVVVCGLDEGSSAIGVTTEAVGAGEEVSVRLLNYGGSVKVVISEAVDVNDLAYCAAAGEASDTAGAGAAIGRFMAAGSAQGSIIEVLLSTGI